jgi:hypothetical protein
MEAKFNLFDLVAYAIPGAILASLLWLITSAIAPGFVLCGLGEVELLATVVFFLASYIFGHAIQAIRWQALKGWKPCPVHILELLLWGRPDEVFKALRTHMFSTELLLEAGQKLPRDATPKLLAHQKLTDGLRAKVKARIRQKFGVPMNEPEDYQLGWELARAQLVTDQRAGHAELYNSLAQMYAGLTLAFRFALTAILVAIIIHVVKWEESPADVERQAWLILIGIVARCLVPLTQGQFRYLEVLFARAVLTGFLATETSDKKTHRTT